jgi:hypothetical protein
VFVWQVSLGNTYFATCNNTNGHYATTSPKCCSRTIPRTPPSRDTSRPAASGGCSMAVRSATPASTTPRRTDHQSSRDRRQPGAQVRIRDDDGGTCGFAQALLQEAPSSWARRRPEPEPAPRALPAPPKQAGAVASPASARPWDEALARP